MSRPVIDETGNRYGRLVVLRRTPNSKRNKALWLCQCECGNTTVVPGSSLRSGSTRSCGCLRAEYASAQGKAKRLPEGEATFNILYCQYRKQAEYRNIVFDLDKDTFRTLTSSPCYYCGNLPTQIKTSLRCYGNYAYNGLDRVDNTKGYTPNNIVPCCRQCNTAKNTMSYDEFREWAERLYKHWIGG